MILGLLSEARRQGHDCEVVLLEGSRGVEWLADFEAAGFPVTLAPHEAGSRLRLGRWLARHLGTDSRPTILHTHFTNWDVPACIAAENGNTKVFWHVHSALTRNPLFVARTAVKFATFGRRVSGVFCPAPNIVDGARKRLAPRDRTHFIPSSLDLDAFPLLDEEYRAGARRELGLDPDAKVLLHFGWHWHLKGSDIFLDTLKLLAEADPKVIGIDRGGTEEMVTRAEELGLGERFRLIPPVDDVRTVHAAGDVMVSSSREEGMAYAVLESLASGTPVVATAIPGHAYLGDQVDACRLTTTAPEDLARAVRETMDRPPEQAAREAEEAHDWMEEHLGHVPIARRVISLYEDAFSKPSAAPVVRRGSGGRPRLIHLCDYPNPEPGSFVPMIASVVESARELGWEAEAIFPADAAGADWHADLTARGLVRRVAPTGGRVELARWAQALSRGESAPAIIHTHFTTYDLPAALAARPGKVAVVWHNHSVLSGRPDVIMRNFFKFSIGGRRVEAVICPSEDLAAAVVGRGLSASKVRFVPNAIDPSRFPVVSEERRAQARKVLGIDQDALVLLSFAWHWHIKGGELYQRAIAKLANESDRKLVALHSTLAPEARELIRELDLSDSIRLQAQSDEVPTMMAATDVFVAASEAEGGTPLAVLEALSSGLPVVASDLPSHKYVARRVPGMSIVDRDPGAMASAMLQAAISGGAGKNGAQASHEAVQRHFSFDHWCSSLFEIYDETAARMFPSQVPPH